MLSNIFTDIEILVWEMVRNGQSNKWCILSVLHCFLVLILCSVTSRAEDKCDMHILPI